MKGRIGGDGIVTGAIFTCWILAQKERRSFDHREDKFEFAALQSAIVRDWGTMQMQVSAHHQLIILTLWIRMGFKYRELSSMVAQGSEVENKRSVRP